MVRLKRAASIASLVALVGLLGCEEARSPSREPVAPAPAPRATPDPARARLERVILAGGLAQFRDGCVSASVWSQVDAPEAGKLLDSLVETFAAAPTLTARDEVACYPSAVHGRLLRRWRTGELELDAELRHANPRVRAAALVLLAHAHARPEAIRAALADPSFDVRMKAFTAVEDTLDHAAEPQLEAIIAKIPPSAPQPAIFDRRWACTTLAALRGSSPCPDVSTGGAAGGLLVSGGGPSRDRCEELRSNLSSPEPTALTRGLFALLRDRSSPLTRPFDPLLHDSAPLPDCGTADAQLEALLEHPVATVRSLAAAALLAARHPPLPTTPATLTPKPQTQKRSLPR
jgi:hypothetical protein